MTLIHPGCDYKEQYQVVKELGRGKFGVVYHVTSKSGKSYAAKHIRTRKREVRERVLEEIDLLHELDNVHIIRFVAAFTNPGEHILVTEYLDGGELFERVADEEFNLTEAEGVQFIRQICSGVRYLHEDKSIVHLDLKPENVVCCHPHSTDVKLIDFGLARRLDPSVPIRVMTGTAEFVPPEVVGYDPVSFGSDMWSVGVICYILLSGFSPFLGETDAETFANISMAEFDFDEPEFDVITPLAKSFISALLVKSPTGRLTASQCLQHPWLMTESEEMRRKINTENLRKFLARRRWQRCGQAVRAMKRLSGLRLKRLSTQESPDDLEELRQSSTESHSTTEIDFSQDAETASLDEVDPSGDAEGPYTSTKMTINLDSARQPKTTYTTTYYTYIRQ